MTTGTGAGRTIIGVIGGSRVDAATEALAEAVGRGIAERGAILVCGGGGGVMAAACRGARGAGGTTLGVLPGHNRAEANPWVEIPIVTGLSEARNLVIVKTAHALVAVDGSFGTLSEIAFALRLGAPVVGLGTWRLAHDALAVPDPIHRATTAADAVELAWRLATGAAT